MGRVGGGVGSGVEVVAGAPVLDVGGGWVDEAWVTGAWVVAGGWVDEAWVAGG